MSDIVIAPIVEGHGDSAAVPILLRRLWEGVATGGYAQVLQPIRRSRGKFLREQEGDLENAVNLALLKLAPFGGGLILILIDAEEDCHRIGPLGPMLLMRARSARADADISCVIANVMYETWFVAAAESLSDVLHVPDPVSEDPETERLGKGWIKQRMRAGKYSETIDQPKLTAKMDLQLCRRRSPSFDKLCRELQKRSSA